MVSSLRDYLGECECDFSVRDMSTAEFKELDF